MRFQRLNDTKIDDLRYKRVFLWFPHKMFWPYGIEGGIIEETRWLEFAYVEQFYDRHQEKYRFNKFITEEIYRTKLIEKESKKIVLRDKK